MTFETCLSAGRVAAMNAAGLWSGRTLLDHLDQAVAGHPDKIAVTAFDTPSGRMTSLSYRQLDRLSRRVAAGLMAGGLEPGQVVSMQLPNRVEFVIVHLACLRAGAITNAVMPFMRHRELRFMLGLAESRVMVVPGSFCGFDHPAMLAELRSDLPALARVVVVDGDGPDSFAQLIDRRWEDAVAPAEWARRRPAADQVIQVLYTSGTTGEPKGVMHTSNTLLSSLPPCNRRLGLGPDDVVLMASPLAHQTGFVYGMAKAIVLGAKLVLQDLWSAEVAARLIQDEGATFTMASTPFLADLAEEAAKGRFDLSSLRIFLSAGAPIPGALVHEARRRLGAHVLSGWGMTENGLVSVTAPDDPPERSAESDGYAFESMALRVVDGETNPLPAGQVGRLQARGAGNFVGYLKRPQAYAVDGDGWFETGDLARLDGAGYLRITGRAKDIIIRGGENIPVIEVENLLYRHPAVRDVAVVGIPDPRLGERACAVVTLREGHELSFDDMVAYFTSHEMARQYVPERLEVLDEMPRTPSGKIQKFRLREQLA